MSFDLNYDSLIPLDAEFLAETGIAERYERILPEFRKYVKNPISIEEIIDNDVPAYSVKFGSKELRIYGPEVDEEDGNSWGRATYAFFTIVNDQLANSSYRFYAIMGGNDLSGMFLTPAQAEAPRETLPNKTDWPYLPNNDPDWYGMFH